MGPRFFSTFIAWKITKRLKTQQSLKLGENKHKFGILRIRKNNKNNQTLLDKTSHRFQVTTKLMLSKRSPFWIDAIVWSYICQVVGQPKWFILKHYNHNVQPESGQSLDQTLGLCQIRSLLILQSGHKFQNTKKGVSDWEENTISHQIWSFLLGLCNKCFLCQLYT